MSGSLESLSGLYNLRILNLSHNYFSDLGSLDFSNMSDLAELYLADNKFGGTVDRVTVHFIFAEISAKFPWNLIENWRLQSFYYLRNLRTADFRNTRLSDFLMYPNNLNSLGYLYLDNNDLSNMKNYYVHWNMTNLTVSKNLMNWNLLVILFS